MKVFASALAAVLAIGMATPAVANAQWLGYVTKGMIDNWCYTHGDAGSRTGQSPRALDPNNAYSWRCSNGSGVNMNSVCDQKYGSPAYSKVDNPRNPGGWYCWR